jgi:hypothetical protein
LGCGHGLEIATNAKIAKESKLKMSKGSTQQSAISEGKMREKRPKVHIGGHVAIRRKNLRRARSARKRGIAGIANRSH